MYENKHDTKCNRQKQYMSAHEKCSINTRDLKYSLCHQPK